MINTAHPRRSTSAQLGAFTPDAVVWLLRHVVEQARTTTYATHADHPAALAAWQRLDDAVETHMVRLQKQSSVDWQGASMDVVAACLALLKRHDPDGTRVASYSDFVGTVDRWSVNFLQLMPASELEPLLHHVVLWQTAWHLTAAGVPTVHIITTLNLNTAPPLTRAEAVMAVVGQKLMPAVADAGRKTAQFVTGFVADMQENHRELGRRREAAQLAQQIERQRLAEERATVERARRNHVRSPSTTEPMLTLDGKALHGSVFGTWLKLVVLSWVSLFWGALISAPFGVGLGIMATAFAGVFVVPLWGTFWGFVGMRRAHDSTLTQMGFEDVATESGLATTTANYAAQLGLPPPRVGTVPAFNAFAIGLDRANATVAIGKPLLDKLTDAEVRAVIGHELGHIASGDMRRMMLMRTFQNATVWFGLAQGLKQVARWIICWAAELAILAFSRKREYWADAVGAALAGTDAMIGALRKLDQAPALTDAENTHARFMFRGRAFSTHPSVEQRIAALEAGTYVGKLPLRA